MAPKRKGAKKAGGGNVGKTCAFEVIEGPLSGNVISNKGRVFRIGRTKASKLQIKDDTVSEKHAELVWRDSSWQIRDLGSSNGTSVNGLDLQGDYVTLNDGDRIRFGEVTVVIFRDVPEEQGAPAVVGSPEQKENREPSEATENDKEGKKVRVVTSMKDDDDVHLDEVEMPGIGMATHEGVPDLTVLEYLEKECCSLQDEIMEKGKSLAEELRQRWNVEKQKLLALL